MTPNARTRGQTLRRVLIVLPLLLAVAVAVNWDSISAIARGDKSVKSVVYGINTDSQTEFAGWKVPADMGSKDARVKVEVYMIGGDPCHIDSLFMGTALGGIDPDRVSVAFRSTNDEKNRERFTKLKLGCEQGMAINGKTKFTVPLKDPTGKRKTRTIYLTKDKGYGLEAIHAVLDSELKKAYDGKGLRLSAEEFAARVDEVAGQTRDRISEEMEKERAEE